MRISATELNLSHGNAYMHQHGIRKQGVHLFGNLQMIKGNLKCINLDSDK